MDVTRTDKTIQYIVALAGQQEFPNNSLRPIHIIKYLYLADLACAEECNGSTFTGAPWRFYHFGPWTEDIFTRIEPALLSVGAACKTFHSKKYEDPVMWSLSDDILFDELDRELPSCVTFSIRRFMRIHGADTYGLLHYVYCTEPMMNAAPGETLIFHGKNREKLIEQTTKTITLTDRQLKKRKNAVDNLRKLVKKRLIEKKSNEYLVDPYPTPVYDEVFFHGVSWLNSLAGQPLQFSKGTAAISNDVWKSGARRDPEVS